jgi:murein DD-endopeptidase MepM/ murein hydrolase activator NlpD
VDGQTLDVSADVVEAAEDRADFKVTSYAEMLQKKYGTRSYSYSPTAGSIRWPFPYATSITDGFGERVAPCRGCSSFHKGIDFTPGQGAATYAIASGVVESSVISNGGLGNEVIINHTIKGQAVQSVYGHLVMKSSPLKAGDTVKVGDFVGLVGRTGTTTGANMHLEIHVNGVAVDPFAWLENNAR